MMKHTLLFIALFVFLIQLNIPCSLWAIELFSISYDGENLTGNILGLSVYDEAKIKEEALNLLILQKEIKKTELKIIENEQNLKTITQEKIAAEEYLKRKKRKVLENILKT